MKQWHMGKGGKAWEKSSQEKRTKLKIITEKMEDMEEKGNQHKICLWEKKPGKWNRTTKTEAKYIVEENFLK